MTEQVKIFISYSHLDSDPKDRLIGHLKTRQRLANFSFWSDEQIEGGDEWYTKIFRELSSSNIIILLISTNFINSKFCYEKEMNMAMSLHDSGRAIVIPVMVCPCNCKGHPFYKLQTIPDNPKTIDEWDNKDRACMNVVDSVEAKVDQLQKQLSNMDIDWRKNEVEDLVGEGSLLQACNRLMDFCNDFANDKYKMKAKSLKAAYNSIVKDTKDNLGERMTLAEKIYDLLEEIRFLPLPNAA